MTWEGYRLETGIYQGYEYGIVFPEEMAPGRPYVWRTEFFGAFPSVDLAMLEKGYGVVYYRIPNLYGSPEAVRLMAAFQPFIQQKYRLSAHAVLFGFSRGGLYALHYGAEYPERVAALYLDAPVVDIYSWPGGFFSAEGSPKEWEDCQRLWQMPHEAFMDRVHRAVQILLTWSVPLILVAGGKDETVPYCENGALLQEAYEKNGGIFQLILKPDCGHHPHSLEEPWPVVAFLLKNRNYPSQGNAFRINDQLLTRYPLTLIVHDRSHLELVTQAEEAFGGRYPLGYVGTSPWPGTVTNQMAMAYTSRQNVELYDLLREQMEIGWVIYGLCFQEESDILFLIKDMREKCPGARQFWMLKKGEQLSCLAQSRFREYGVCLVEYEGQQEYGKWLENLGKEIGKAKPPEWHTSLEREEAEWANLSIVLPRETLPEEEGRILLVGDSISAGYGDMVQKLMPGWHVDRLNTSEGIHHPNFKRLLEIALRPCFYHMVHINNGIHLHGQSVEQYGENLLKVFGHIREISPGTKIVFATTTPVSRLTQWEGGKGGFWEIDGQASEIYRKLNDRAEKICMEEGICVDHLYQLCVEENLQKSDTVHFRQDAYWRLAAKVAETLEREHIHGA